MYFYIYLFPIRKNCDLFTHTSLHTPSLLGNFFFLIFFFYELIKDQSIEKKLYYYSVGVCVCAWLCFFFWRTCVWMLQCLIFFLIIFPLKKYFFLTGCLWFVRDLKPHHLFLLSKTRLSFFLLLHLSKWDSFLLANFWLSEIRFWISRILYWAREWCFLIVVFFIIKWKFVVSVVFTSFFISWKRNFLSIFSISIFLLFEKENVIFSTSRSTREKKQTKQTSWHFFIQLLFSLYKIISKIPPLKKNNFN